MTPTHEPTAAQSEWITGLYAMADMSHVQYELDERGLMWADAISNAGGEAEHVRWMVRPNGEAKIL